MCSFSLSLASHPCSNQAPCFTKALRNAWKLLELTLPENSNFGSLEDSHLTNPRFLHPSWYYLVCQICNYSIICFNHKHESCYWLSTRSRAFWIFILFPKIWWTEIIWWWAYTWNWSGRGWNESPWVYTYQSILQIVSFCQILISAARLAILGVTRAL